MDSVMTGNTEADLENVKIGLRIAAIDSAVLSGDSLTLPLKVHGWSRYPWNTSQRNNRAEGIKNTLLWVYFHIRCIVIGDERYIYITGIVRTLYIHIQHNMAS